MDIQQAYAELDLSEGSTSAMIKTKYRKLVLELHPDRNEGKNEKQIQRITEAYNVLKDTSLHRKSASEQRKAQDARNIQREQGRAEPRRTMREGKTPEEDWSHFTSEYEADATFWKEYESNFWQDYEKRRNTNSKFNKESKNESKKQKYDSSPNHTSTPLRFQIHIEESLCIGCCSCETIAPSTFHVNKNAKVNPKSSVIDPLGNSTETMMDAAETCPTKAIIVNDLLTKRQVYPL